MPRRIESLSIQGPVGNLEALLEEPEDLGAAAPRLAALVCHPHPQHGGTMHNKVVYRIARGLRRAGLVVLRFNYRGVNLSAGTYDRGEGEKDDAAAALEFLRRRYPDLPYALAGFSFGSRIVLRLGCELADPPARVVAVGFPARHPESLQLGNCDRPRVFIQSTNDQFGPAAEMQAYFDGLTGPKELLWVPARDHFFADALDQFEETVLQVGTAITM
ncbi:MAG: alpha/beta fold hydrolase [Acidobacteriota bacterium]|nr:alpha/beta fold hydrolase [Acidobacteriota bacterium]